MPADTYVLRFKNGRGEVFYFVKHGMEHKNLRLIEHTTADVEQAHNFDTYPEGITAWNIAGQPPGWDVVINPLAPKL